MNQLAGIRSGRLIAIRPIEKDNQGRWRWLCHCDCGGEIITRGHHIAKRICTSCGCYQRELRATASRFARHGSDSHLYKHGMTYSPEWRCWKKMIERCHGQPKEADRKNYQDRGITVCEEWRNSFAAFYRDVGPKPSPELSIDRIDNDGNYEPSNCRWATRKQQNNNTRRQKR